MKKLVISLFLIFPGLIFSWDLAKESDGIKVYNRSVEGSDLKEFKAVGKVKSTLSGLVALLKDEGAFTGWYPDCKEAKILKDNGTSWYTYFQVKAPFPVSNRDTINLFSFSQSVDKSVTLALTGNPEYIPAKSGVIRIPKLKGFWLFTPKEDGFVEVTYQVHSEPGGSLPSWLANSVSTDVPLKVLKNLKSKVAEEKYQSAKFDFVKE
jgi:hypothetical protein